VPSTSTSTVSLWRQPQSISQGTTLKGRWISSRKKDSGREVWISTSTPAGSASIKAELRTAWPKPCPLRKKAIFFTPVVKTMGIRDGSRCVSGRGQDVRQGEMHILLQYHVVFGFGPGKFLLNPFDHVLDQIFRRRSSRRY